MMYCNIHTYIINKLILTHTHTYTHIHIHTHTNIEYHPLCIVGPTLKRLYDNYIYTFLYEIWYTKVTLFSCVTGIAVPENSR